MAERQHIQDLIGDFIKESNIFIVSVKVSSSNKITVLADTKNGITIEECASIHRYIANILDQEAEEYELQVSSPGLDSPFQVFEQYLRNIGKRVEVVDNEGVKYTGKLLNVFKGGFEIESEIKVKGKPREMKEVSFNFDEIKSTRVILTIK